MELQCKKCKTSGPKHEFRFLSHADSAGTVVYRQCPNCHAAVLCQEMEEEDQYLSGRVWGTSGLRGMVFSRKNRAKDELVGKTPDQS